MPQLPDLEPLAARLRGYQLPGGEYTISAAERSTVAALNEPLDTDPHPIFCCISSLKSLGVSIGELCTLCEFNLTDGPLLGECAVVFERAFREGIRYTCSATIESFERSRSLRHGVLDRLRFTVFIDEPQLGRVATVRYLWLLPRGRVS